jgi:recombination protein RecT
MAQNLAVTKLKNKVISTETKKVDMATFIRNQIDELGKALPSFITPERFVRIAVTSMRLNPKLAECSQMSILGALFQSAQLGLEPNIEGQAYLIPYNNSKQIVDPDTGRKKWVKRYECQFQIGYKGYIELFYRHGAALTLDMHTVYENDIFEYSYGTNPYLKHCPVLKDRGEPVAYYAVATLRNGGSIFKVMSKDECVEHGKTHSKCYITREWDDRSKTYVPVTPHFEANSPWAKDLNAMCKKTVLIQLAKLLPKSVELQKALAMDNTTKSVIQADMFAIPDETNWDENQTYLQNSVSKLPPEQNSVGE